MNRSRIHCLVFLLFLAGGIPSGNAASLSGSAENLDSRMRALSSELRCLVCQNQTLLDSDASLAVDLRREIRGMMVSGSSDREIIDYLVNRYGDFVLYRPPLKGATALLWFGPLILALLSIVFFILAVRRRNVMSELSGVDEVRERGAKSSC